MIVNFFFNFSEIRVKTDMPRKYTKRNKDYWQSKSKKMSAQKSKVENDDFEIETFGEPLISFEESLAAGSRLTEPTGRTSSRRNRVSGKPVKKRFENIEDGILPYEYSKDLVSVKDSIVLSQKAYFNVSVYKSTIDLLSEFANTDLILDNKTGSKSSRKFVEAWLRKIRIHDLKEQCFREYYRSGNVFPYTVEIGKIKNARKFDIPLAKLKEGVNLPIKYIILNPADIGVKNQLDFGEYTYAKALTPFEIARLKDSKNEEAKEMFKSLPKEIKDQIKDEKTTGVNKEIHLPLDVDLIHPIFYKKQDYEPLAIPMGFAVLDDINKKIELKKIDQAIARSIENVVLLVTMGAEPDKGGVNHKNIAAMQEIFKNQSVGRVLVSDYTTKADFVIPDLKKVMGKDKYEVLNKDIEEGLANILLGESKYSDTELKLKIFFERLEEARGRFLRDFLQPEIDRICKEVGFKQTPQAKFVKKDTITNADLQKLVTRMTELGILTPEQGIQVINEGSFPKVEEMRDAQKRYVEDREEGYYQPIINSNMFMEQDEVEESSMETSKQKDGQLKPKGHRQKNTNSSPSGGRPVGTASKYSVNSLLQLTEKLKSLESSAQSIYKKELKLRKLTKEKKDLIAELCCKVAASSEIEEWESQLKEIIKDNSKLLDLSVNPDVISIAAKHGLDDYSAALLYHSTKLENA